ncbi:MAG TPA: IclR family transcriptional regulator C-terminal domain-containing protein [Actinophytocola sp.]|uniref:IclR family transcriptional regulator domain-containing protein n=1 Tax=Actinophytocola sp. TaxID=1872138 RepID=UPI002DDD3A41|nr:IclR family transcriptional regulator C-terminal domain-containing protein [Actinophytocola sp.]HEV2784212.1 IclR family transcriptional regulator C-terminal domain-containing protein [Actinophytocola sp.]
MKAAEDKDYVQSLERGLAVLLAFSDKHPRLTLGQLSGLTGLSRPTVRRLVLTLARLGYVREEGRAYALTPHVLALGYAFTSSLNLTELAQPQMEEVTEVTGHTCSLAALDGEDAVFLLRVPSRRAMQHLLLTGTRLPAFASAIGRVLLGGLPDPEVDSFLRHAPFPRLTPHTETDPDRLRARISQVRKQGWELVDQELEEGVRSFSAPVRASGGRVIAALGMSVHAGTVSIAEIHRAYLPPLIKAAKEISSRLGASYHPNGQYSSRQPSPGESSAYA